MTWHETPEMPWALWVDLVPSIFVSPLAAIYYHRDSSMTAGARITQGKE
jgi:hypothetical protein